MPLGRVDEWEEELGFGSHSRLRRDTASQRMGKLSVVLLFYSLGLTRALPLSGSYD